MAASQWLEWEETCLRPAALLDSAETLQKAFQHVASAVGSKQYALGGSAPSVADVSAAGLSLLCGLWVRTCVRLRVWEAHRCLLLFSRLAPWQPVAKKAHAVRQRCTSARPAALITPPPPVSISLPCPYPLSRPLLLLVRPPSLLPPPQVALFASLLPHKLGGGGGGGASAPALPQALAAYVDRLSALPGFKEGTETVSSRFSLRIDGDGNSSSDGL